jgi:hypothetical protein
MLRALERGRLTGRPGNDQPVSPVIDMKIDQALETRIIDAIIAIERLLSNGVTSATRLPLNTNVPRHK